MTWKINGPSREGYVPGEPFPVALVQREGKGWYSYARLTGQHWTHKENWPTWKLAGAKHWAEQLYEKLLKHSQRTDR